MFSETIFHPVSGEKGYFVSEKDAEFIKVIVADFKFNRLTSLEQEYGVAE